MADQSSVPGIGPVDKKWVYAGGALIVGVVGYAYIKRRNANQAAAAAAPTVDTTTGATGSTGYVTPPNLGNYPVQTSTAPTTNSAWVQQATTDLEGLGYDPNFISTTLGLYLSSQSLTSDQAALVRVAWAYDGKPPETPNLPIVGGTTGGTTNPPTAAPGAVTGLRAIVWGSNYATFGFQPVSGADHYDVTEQSGGTRTIYGGTTQEIQFTEGGALGGNLKFPYTQQVRAVNSFGPGPWASTTIQSPGGTH